MVSARWINAGYNATREHMLRIFRRDFTTTQKLQNKTGLFEPLGVPKP